MKRFSWLFAILVVVLAAPVFAQAQTEPPSAPETEIAERSTADQIVWQPCRENAALECGTLALPVDYKQPRGETFDMAVIRAKATDPSKRIGVLFTNPGGPGASGVNLVLGGIAARAPIVTRVRERFDIIGFDVRGSHRSRPVRCEVTVGEPPVDQGDAALAAFFDDLSRRYVQACRDQNGSFIFSMSMNNIARDMDALRRALNERKISYIGISFGTQLGAVYASMFPQRLRATLLDAGAAPETRDGLVEFWSEHFSAFEFAFQHLDQLCRRDSACQLHETGVVAAFDALIMRLKAQPVTSPDGTTLTAANVTDAIGELLYDEPLWPLIVHAIAGAHAGDYTLLFDLVGAPSAGNSALIPILCNTYGTRRAAADLLPFDAAFDAANPRFFGRFSLSSLVALCAAWPKADQTIIRNVQRSVATPIVLIGNDFDNATPMSWTRSLAFALGMEQTVVRYQGGGHAVITRGNQCTDDVIVAYLADLHLPTEGFTCAALPISFAQSVQANRMQSLDATMNDAWQVEPLRIP